MAIQRISLKGLQEKRDFYMGYIQHMKQRVADIDFLLKRNPIANPTETIVEELPNVGALDIAKLEIERDELTAKITNQQQNLDVYLTRIEMRIPEFEKESQEANMNWAALWDKAMIIAAKEPGGEIARLYKTIQDNRDQEEKNEIYFNLKALIEKSGSKGSMKVQR